MASAGAAVEHSLERIRAQEADVGAWAEIDAAVREGASDGD